MDPVILTFKYISSKKKKKRHKRRRGNNLKIGYFADLKKVLPCRLKGHTGRYKKRRETSMLGTPEVQD